MLNIRVSGPAGMWINSTADIIWNIFAWLWYKVTGDSEYQSLIKWWVNWFDLNIDKDKNYISKYVDIFLCFNAENLDKNLSFLRQESIVIINEKWLEKITDETKQGIHEKHIHVLSLKIDDKYDNTYLLGVLVQLMKLPREVVQDEISRVFGRKGQDIVTKNIQIVEDIVETYQSDFSKEYDIKTVWAPRVFTYGNKMIASGAVAGELEFFSAYPMTPASSILTEVINDGSVKFLQAEDEVSVINTALWASYTWARSMVATSGGGFALMTEALSFSLQAEIPITVAFSMRAGPSTGTPTFLETGDINFALNPTFGDFTHVVMTPSSFEEAYFFSGLSLNLADQYQQPVILLTDKQFSECHTTLNWELQAVSVNRGKIVEKPSENYKRYELTEDAISPRVKIGTKNGDHIATSYEHDEFGATSEDPEMKMKMTEKRARKIANFYKDQDFKWYEIINPTAQKFLLTTSFTSYTAKEFIKQHPEYGLVIITFLKPLDERLIADLQWKQEVIFFENNMSGQLEKYMTQELKLDEISGLTLSHCRKYDLYPFYIEDFEDRLLHK